MIPTGPIEWGSSRMRVHWLAEAWDEAWVWQGTPEMSWDELLRDVEVVVLQQKSLHELHVPLFEKAHSKGIPVVWDVCDPIWWWDPRTRREAQRVDFIVASNDGLAAAARKDLKKPTICIPDRHKIDAFGVKTHGPTDIPALLWHGHQATEAKLWMCTAQLAKLTADGVRFKLIIIVDGEPHVPKALSDWNWVKTMGDTIQFVKWTWPGCYKDGLRLADVGLMPPYPGIWGGLKSNNSTVCFWMAGVPVTTGESLAELRSLLGDWKLRERLGKQLRAVAVRDWCIEKSVEDWKRLVAVL